MSEIMLTVCLLRTGSPVSVVTWAVVVDTRHQTTLLTHCANYMVCLKTLLYNKTLHQQLMFSLFQITIRSHKQLPPIHSQTFLPFYPSLIVPASPSVAAACGVYLPARWLCVRMALAMTDCKYRVVLPRGLVNLWLLSVPLLTDWWSLIYAILRCLEQTHCARMWFYMSG